ncbi:MAG: hypothetical protein Q9206_003219 [Seirophora lacunosa]
MVEGDADRCPSDLPVVPMQLSLRDIVAMATMAGMECTDVSFQAQSISMQGDAGTITSSRHPVLGALVHFAPKQHFEQSGMQALNGRIHPDWLARMLDIVAVAGRRFDLRDRKHYEDDEGSWIKVSSSRAPNQDMEPVRVGAVASSGPLRHRHPLKIQGSSGAGEQGPIEVDHDFQATRRVQDGEWLFTSSNESNVNESYEQQVRHRFAMPTTSPKPAVRKPKSIPNWIRGVLPIAHSERGHHILPTSERRHGNTVETLDNRSIGILSNLWHRNNFKIVKRESGGGAHNTQALHQSSEAKLDRPDTASILTVEKLQEPHGSSEIESQHADEAKLGKSQSQLLLTNGDRCTWERGAIPNHLSPQGKTMEAQRKSARDDFVANRWQQTFLQRRNERSRGRSQNQVERSLILRQRSTPNIRLGPSAYEGRKLRKKRSLRYSKLALDNSLPRETGQRGDTGSDPDTSNSFMHNDRGRPMKTPVSVRTTLRSQHRHLSDKATGHPLSLPPSSDSIGNTGRRSRSHQDRKKARIAFNTNRRVSISSDEDLPRGRRRNSRLATTSLESRAQHNDLPQDKKTALADASVRMESTSPLQGAKRVRVLLPEEVVEDPPPLELSPRSGSFSPEMKPVLRRPTEHFPEDPDFVRPGVASVDQARAGTAIPEGARWTEISRRLVSLEALELGRERFEEKQDYFVVLRVLTKEEIQQYAIFTQKLRLNRAQSTSTTSEAHEDAKSEDESAYYTQDPELPGSLERERHQSVVLKSSATAIHSLESPNSDDAAKYRRETTQPGSEVDESSTTKQTASQRGAARKSRHNHKAARGSLTESKNSELEKAGHKKALAYEFGPSPVVDPAESYSEHEIEESDMRQYPSPTKQQNSSSRHRSSRDHSFLTYDEELLFLHSDSILKRLQSCTEQCKDIITTFDVCISFEPDFGYNLGEICQLVRRCNASLKDLLMTVNPLRDHKKAAEIVVADLDILLHGLLASLDILGSEFDPIDITSMTSDAREIALWNTLSAFEKKFPCSMPDSLDLVQRFAKEITANFKVGVFKSPESALLKQRVAHASGHNHLSNSTLSPTVEVSSDPSRFGFHSRPWTLLSPSRYVQSPSRATPAGGPTRQRSDPSECDDESVDRKQDRLTAAGHRHAYTDMTHRAQYGHDSSGDGSSSSTATLTSWKSNTDGQVSWFWVSQADVLPGYFATPWKSMFSEATCNGAIAVILKTVEGFTSKSSLRYVASHEECKDWLRLGKTTYPSYAHEAKGGVVVAGVYERVRFEAFGSTVASLRLLKSYDFQVGGSYQSSTQAVVDSIAELMSLDSWLSICGRTGEISDGPSGLLQSAPTLMQRVMKDFDLEFSSVERASRSGGLRMIKTMSESLLQFLEEQNLSKAERLFALVALLRTAKMALCIARGVDTAKLRDVLIHDVQVYMA